MDLEKEAHRLRLNDAMRRLSDLNALSYEEFNESAARAELARKAAIRRELQQRLHVERKVLMRDGIPQENLSLPLIEVEEIDIGEAIRRGFFF